MFKKTLIAAASGAVLIAMLAGCSANDSGPKPSTSSTPSASVKADSTVYNKCVDGQATILVSKLAKKFALEGDCKTVSIVGQAKKGATIELPALDLLVIEGDATHVTAKSATKIVFAGNDNAVTCGGQAEVDDQGSGNTATAK